MHTHASAWTNCYDSACNLDVVASHRRRRRNCTRFPVQLERIITIFARATTRDHARRTYTVFWHRGHHTRETVFYSSSLCTSCGSSLRAMTDVFVLGLLSFAAIFCSCCNSQTVPLTDGGGGDVAIPLTSPVGGYAVFECPTVPQPPETDRGIRPAVVIRWTKDVSAPYLSLSLNPRR